jgi:hypothetical protein
MAKNTKEPQRSAALKVAETRRRRKTKEAIYKVLWLPHKLQDKLMRECVIDDDLYALARHFRWRAVCSGGKRGGFRAWRAAFIPMFRKVESRMNRTRAATARIRAKKKVVAKPPRDRNIRMR